MNDIEREDISEQIELEKVVDTNNIPYDKLMRVIIDFVLDAYSHDIRPHVRIASDR